MGDILWPSLENTTYRTKFSEHCFISTIYVLAIFIQHVFIEHLLCTSYCPREISSEHHSGGPCVGGLTGGKLQAQTR